MEFIDLKAQYKALSNEINKAVLNVMEESAYILGPDVELFEQELAERAQVKHCVSCANGTDALVITLMAKDIGPGDAVFVPSFTFMSTAECASNVGATPVMCDIDLRTYNLDPESLEQAIVRVKEEGKLRPAAVIAVDLFGQCADYPAIEAICKKHDLYLIEDAAQGYGGSIHGQMALSFGDVSITSFFPAKPLGCYGDGGALLTNDDELAELFRSIRVHGRGEHKYDNVRVGMNSRLDTMQAAILRIKLEAFHDYEMDRRQEVAAFYDASLRDLFETPFVPAGYISSWAQYTLLLDNQAKRDELQKKLKEQGIPSMVYYAKPLHLQTVYADLGYKEGDLPNSEAASQRVLQIPMHPYLSSEDAKRVVTALRNAI